MYCLMAGRLNFPGVQKNTRYKSYVVKLLGDASG